MLPLKRPLLLEIALQFLVFERIAKPGGMMVNLHLNLVEHIHFGMVPGLLAEAVTA